VSATEGENIHNLCICHVLFIVQLPVSKFPQELLHDFVLIFLIGVEKSRKSVFRHQFHKHFCLFSHGFAEILYAVKIDGTFPIRRNPIRRN